MLQQYGSIGRGEDYVPRGQCEWYPDLAKAVIMLDPLIGGIRPRGARRASNGRAANDRRKAKSERVEEPKKSVCNDSAADQAAVK